MTQVTAVLAVVPITTCPPNHTSLTPFLCIDGASAAIDFYVSVFGAKLVDRMDDPNGIVAHAELDFGNGRLQLSDPQEAYQIAAPDPNAFATHSIAFYRPDVDDVVARAERGGATIREPAQTFVTGALAEHGIPLASNQVQINLLHRRIERNGVLETGRRLGVTLIAYSPLASGMLTGKFHADRSLLTNMPRARRMINGLTDKHLDRTAPLIDGLREIAAAHQATISQVALAWLITYYGDTVVAIPGASKPHHAEKAAGALKVDLSRDESARLADLSRGVTG